MRRWTQPTLGGPGREVLQEPPAHQPEHTAAGEPDPGGYRNAGTGATTRRQFLGYAIAAPFLVVAADAVGSGSAPAGSSQALEAAVALPAPAGFPSLPQPADILDLGDLLILAGLPTANLLYLQVASDGTVNFVLPRAENGQGLVTAMAMVIADEMEVALSDVVVTLAPAEPKLLFNQLTGSSNSVRSLWDPVRTAAAAARGRLLSAAADLLDEPIGSLTVLDGVVSAPSGKSITYGQLTSMAAVSQSIAVQATPKDPSQYRIIGTPQPQLANLDIVTGRQRYAMDIDVPGALPTMVRRAPTIKGTLVSFDNPDAVRAMPGIVDVAVFAFGVAVVGNTFGQVIDAIDMVEATWAPGPVAGENDGTVRAQLVAAPTVPFLVPPLLGTAVQATFDWAPVNHAPMETNVAVADVRTDRATVWAPLQTPIAALQAIAGALGMSEDRVTVNVLRGGGSFGRTLFFDAALESAMISKAVGRPVKLMWHRTNDMRHGRGHPQAHHRLQAVHLAGEVLSFEHRVTSVITNVSAGLGEALTAEADKLPPGKLTFGQTLFETTITCPYNFGVVSQLLTEVPLAFNTDSWRSVFSYNTRGAEEIFIDKVAASMGRDPVEFRLAHMSDDRQRAVLEKVADVGNWGRVMPAGTAQGVGFHQEFRSYTACLVEIDVTARAEPRVTKAVVAIDVGLPINPSSLEGQMLGGLTDAISLVLTMGNHIEEGLPIESGWAHFRYARQGDTPPEVTVIVMPPVSDRPGGAGELGVPAAVGAIGNAYARATGSVPTSFPVSFTIDWTPPPPGPVPKSPLQPLPAPGELYNY
ncbi:MAG: xanthine dehydrogenase family protein molybdopterin-binding subunit [Acidimicrobiales bacterium]